MRSLGDDALDRLAAVVRGAEPSHPRYELGELLGSGGMGSVYQAVDRQLGRDVAIKVLKAAAAHPSLAVRLDREARILAGLDHPGLVPVHDAGTLADGRPFYVMRLIRGERLDRHLARLGSLAERLRLFLRICEPVGFAHANGVVHRDLKPANIMVGPFGEVLVLDWGIAKTRDPEPVGSTGIAASAGSTGPGTILGTAGYMAPEQAAGASAQVDERADVHALGAILADLTGSLPAVPRPVAAIRDRARAPAPGDRYPSVTALAADVARFLDGEPVTAYAETWLDRAERFGARHQLAIGLIAAYLLMRLLLLVFGAR